MLFRSNKFTRGDSFPTPDITDVIHKVGKAFWISSWDTPRAQQPTTGIGLHGRNVGRRMIEFQSNGNRTPVESQSNRSRIVVVPSNVPLQRVMNSDQFQHALGLHSAYWCTSHFNGTTTTPTFITDMIQPVTRRQRHHRSSFGNE